MGRDPHREAYIGPFCDDNLRDEFQRAVDRLDLRKVRELCMEHNPGDTFAKFRSRSVDLERSSTKPMSVVRLVEDRAFYCKERIAQDMAVFVRVMALKFLPFVVAASLIAC